jgi:hypothetical protein
MLSRQTRAAILELASRKNGTREIARALGVSRGAVKKVIALQTSEVPVIARSELAAAHRDEILQLVTTCNGNLVRVHVVLLAQGAELSYPALTAFCRRAGIGGTPKQAAGSYHFEPGTEMQHDTSPHSVPLGGKVCGVQTASLVLCYSRMLFFQHYPTFSRFECKVFMTEALRYLGGAAAVAMIDNTSVVAARGTGADMVPAPEMVALGERYGFTWRAHEVGDANRSARVERPFSFIENNFLVGRRFADWVDLNAQARSWCDTVNGRFKRHLRAVPRELFAVERGALRPLPIWVPEVYRLHLRIVDVEGYVSVHTNRYSVPEDWIGRHVEARETWERIEISSGLRDHVSHDRVVEPAGTRVTRPEHRRPRGQRPKAGAPMVEELAILEAAPELAAYLADLKRRGRSPLRLALRRLLRLVREYPRDPLRAAVGEAHHYGLYDLERVESIVLSRLADEYFRLDSALEEP